MSSVSASPSKLSMRSLNNPAPTKAQRPSFVPPIRKLVPGDESPRQLSQATAATTLVNLETAKRNSIGSVIETPSSIQSPVKTNNAAKRIRNITDKVGPLGLSG